MIEMLNLAEICKGTITKLLEHIKKSGKYIIPRNKKWTNQETALRQTKN